MSFLSQPITLQRLFGRGDRKIDDITVQVIINEETNDTLTITKQPVQTGASITDHAYKEPTVLTMNILAQDNENFIPTFSQVLSNFASPGTNGLAEIYKRFIELQESRRPFIVLTPKRIYKSMLISVIRQVTDKNTENILSLGVSFQEVVIVTIGVATVPPVQQRLPKVTQAIQNKGKQSAFLTGAQAVNPNIVGVQGR